MDFQSFVVEKVGEILEYIDKNLGNICNMDPSLIQFIPTYVWKTKIHRLCVEEILPYLTSDMKRKFEELQPCRFHYNNNSSDEDIDVVGGAPPAIMDCRLCKENKALSQE